MNLMNGIQPVNPIKAIEADKEHLRRRWYNLPRPKPIKLRSADPVAPADLVKPIIRPTNNESRSIRVKAERKRLEYHFLMHTKPDIAKLVLKHNLTGHRLGDMKTGKLLGNGFFSEVYELTDKLVLKVCINNTDRWPEWAEFCINSRDKPYAKYLPRIHYFRRVGDCYIAVLDRLTDFIPDRQLNSRRLSKQTKDALAIIAEGAIKSGRRRLPFDIEFGLSYWFHCNPDAVHVSNRWCNDLIEQMIEDLKEEVQSRLDIHEGNVMHGPTGIVLTDPIA